MSAIETLEPLSLHELVNLLNKPSRKPVQKLEISQDWMEALRQPAEAELHLHTQALTVLVDEVARLRRQLAGSEARRKELEQLIDADPLCPVLNRRAFERELERAVALCRRTRRPGSVLFLDMNGLKHINDTYGHALGDRAIERLARMLVLSCRQTDLIARLGGDEFAVLMPDTPPSGALVRGERVIDLLKRVPLLGGPHPLILSAAYGAAAFDGSQAAADVLNRADAEMYACKLAQKQINSN